MTDKADLVPYDAPGKEVKKYGNYDFYLDYNSFDEAQRRAQALSTSGLIPDRFKGKDNVGSVLQALNIAKRLNTDVMAVFQNVYNVKGQIGLTGKFIHALITNCGYFSPLDFDFKYDEHGKVIACKVTAIDYRIEKVRSMTLTWNEVTAAGWNKNKGSMPSPWNIYRQMMFVYRVVSHFGKTYAPDVILGMQSVEEIKDAQRFNNPTTTLRRRKTLTHKDVQEPDEIKTTTLEPQAIEPDLLIHEYEPPTLSRSKPYIDDPKFDPTVPVDDYEQGAQSEATPETDNWWDDMRHWQYRKSIDFYLIVMIGFGIAFKTHTVKMFDDEGNEIEGHVLGEEDKDRYFKMAKENASAVCSLPDASKEIYERVTRKFVFNCGFDKNAFVDFENS